MKEYVSLVIKTIVKITNRYIEVENDDEFSIGIGALNEAIDRYSGDKGNFINYAALVIRSRIIDYERKIKKHSNVISINQMEDEDGSKLQLKTDGDDIAYSLEIREQIQKFK
ncbi:MAG: sigma factor, partial [Bacillota bacterium]|nr:sigma factor [Bacillota bacterium]